MLPLSRFSCSCSSHDISDRSCKLLASSLPLSRAGCRSLAGRIISLLVASTRTSSLRRGKELKEGATKEARKAGGRDYTEMVGKLMKEVVEQNPLTEVFATATEAS